VLASATLELHTSLSRDQGALAYLEVLTLHVLHAAQLYTYLHMQTVQISEERVLV
jgi:hypothetical protein